MTTSKRFVLKSWNYNKLQGVIWDNLNNEELVLSLFGIIELLNEVSQQEYDLLRLREDVCKRIDLIMGVEYD